MTKILEHNIQRYENQSYYYLRVALVYLCVLAALSANYQLHGATVVVVLAGLMLVVGYGRADYEWTESSDIAELNAKVVTLRVARMKRVRLILILSTFVALTIDTLMELQWL